jgi:hypothetical protein
MKIEYNFTKEAWFTFNESITFSSKKIKQTKTMMTFFLPVISLILVLIDLLNNTAQIPLWIFLGTVSILWVIFYPKRFTKRIKSNIKKQIDKPENNGLFGLYKTTFNEVEILTKTELSEATIKWSGIIKFEETDSYLYLYNTTLSAIVIPKSLINGDIDEVIKHIKKYTNFN